MGIRVSKTLINKQLKGHPDYPSLCASISDLLHHLGIENAAFHSEKDQLHEISTPFLAPQEGSGRFVVVENRDRLENSFPGFFKTWRKSAVVVCRKPLTQDHKENNELLQKRVSRLKSSRDLLGHTFYPGCILVHFPGILPTLLIIALAGIFISALIISRSRYRKQDYDQVCGGKPLRDVIHAKSLNFLGHSLERYWFYTRFVLFISLLFSVYAGNLAATARYSVLAAAAVYHCFSVYFQSEGCPKEWLPPLPDHLGLFLLSGCYPVPGSDAHFMEVSEVGKTRYLLPQQLLQAEPGFSFPAPGKTNPWKNYEGRGSEKQKAVFMALLEKPKSVDVTPMGE